MIRIASQSGTNQYDQDGRAITEWDAKKCAWIVLPEFENENIDWCDLPGGYTLKEYEKEYPNWDKKPEIDVTWYWNTKEAAINAFGHPRSFGKSWDYWDKEIYPYTHSQSWGYIDAERSTVVERFGKYCNFNQYANRTVVRYNSEILFDGVLK